MFLTYSFLLHTANLYSGVASYAHLTYANSTIRSRQKINPSMERNLKITHGITDVLKPYQEMFQQH
jgi:hypothetical protein